MKKLILYCYYESEISKYNLEFFIKNGMVYDDNYDFFIIVNGENFSVDLPKINNLKVFKRENYGFDFGAWGYGLEIAKFYNYDYFIFINSTCIGPFIPRYIPKSLNWVDLFISPINKEYKLCGPTINYLKTNNISNTPHIQSFAFCTDLIGVDLLVKNNVFSPEKDILRKDIIKNHEIGLSKVITDNFYKLFAFQLSENINSKTVGFHHDDIHYNGKYYGDTINPVEVMFIKNNRINNITLKNYMSFLA